MDALVIGQNVLLAAAGAFGVLILFWTMTMRPKADLKRLEQAGHLRPEVGPVERLDRFLKQANLDIGAVEFLQVSVVIGGLAGVAAWLLTGALIAFVAGFAVGGLTYWSYLTDRRDTQRAQYQDALADVVDLMIEGFQNGQTIETALEGVAHHGPTLVRADFQWVVTQLKLKETREKTLRKLADRRRDSVLDVIVEMLLAQDIQGGKAIELLQGLRESVTNRIQLRARLRAEQAAPKWEIRLTAGVIVLIVLFARITNPAYVEFWQTPIGSVTLLLAIGLGVAGYLIANYVLISSTRVEESFGVVRGEGLVLLDEKEAGDPLDYRPR